METTAGNTQESEPPYVVIDRPKLVPKETSPGELSASLIRILVRPDYYHSKKVCVAGFLRVQHEGNAIYLSKDEDQHMMSCNALWVSFDSNTMQMSYEDIAKQFNGKYVYLAGTFDKENRGHMNGYQGAITDITHIQIKLDRSEIRQLLLDNISEPKKPTESNQLGNGRN